MSGFNTHFFKHIARTVVAVSTAILLFTSATASATILKDKKELDWASFRDLTSSQFSTKFTEYKNKGYLMIDIDAYSVGSSLRYSMVWRKNTDKRGWAEHRNMSHSQYHAKWLEYKKKGYRPLDIAAYQSNGQMRYAGIWVQNKEKLAWSSHRNLTSSSYGDLFKKKAKKKYRLVDMEAYQTPSGLRYSAIWYKNTDNRSWAQLRNMTRSKYLEEGGKRARNGYMVVDFESYPTSSGRRYAAIWEKKPGYAYQVRTDRSKTAFANLWREYRDMGYRLVDFERNGNLYSGVWVENNARFRYSKKRQLNNAVEDYLDANNLPGISVAIIENGKTRYRRGFGFADINDNKVAHSGTVYNTASVSKVIGGTLAAKLEDEQVLRNGASFWLDLSEETQDYLTNIPNHHEHTLEQLLSHTGCVPHYNTNPGISNQTNHYWSATSASSSIWNNSLLNSCTIGSSWNYSTHAFTFVAGALEQATGRNINTLLRNELTTPYGLGSMRMQFSSSSLPSNYERATPYTNSNNETSYGNNSWKVLGGGIETNVYDLARFGWKTLNGTILSANARDNRLWTRVNPSFNRGLGWQLTTRNGGKRVAQHGGSWTGARAHLRVYRDDSLVIAILSNRTNHTVDGVDTLSTDLANIVLN